MKTLVVIPARANSSRVPGKNMMEIGGKPCLQHGIERALAGQYQPTVAVASDDPAALELAERLGAIALEEPPELAGADNVYHVLRWACGQLEKHMDRFELVGNGYANVPVAPPDVFDRLFHVLAVSGCDSVCLMAEVPSHWHVYQCHQDVGQGRMLPAMIGNCWINSQQYPKLYASTGGGSAFRRDAIDRLAEDRQRMRKMDSRAVVVGAQEVIEIDTLEDVQWAEFLLSRATSSDLPTQSAT